MGYEVIEKIKQGAEYDIVFTDIMMSDMDDLTSVASNMSIEGVIRCQNFL